MKLKELFEAEERSVLSVFGPQEDIPGNFYVDTRALTSLEGCPNKIDGTFSCFGNRLVSLKGGPEFVTGSYQVNSNHLESLEFCPKKIPVDFYCSSNRLKNLEGTPSVVGRSYYANNNEITSLKGIHKHIKFIGNTAEFHSNPISSHVLGLLRIEGLQKVSLDNYRVQDIINRHLEFANPDIFACQEQLIAAGYEDFAQL